MPDSRRLIYVIGVPGAGKSAVLDAAIAAAGWERSSISTTPFLHEWYANRGPADRRLRAAYLGGHRDRFSGTDMLALNVQPRVLAWLEMLDFPLIIGEGDRLGNSSFFEAARNRCAQLVVVLLDTPDEGAAARREQRGSQQNPAWVIPGTPFTTITVNNTFPTGVHTDKGDLGEGFSTIAVLRRGHYEGCHLVFPEYGVAADLQDGGQILMDAHEWHGNTHMVGLTPDAERISVVAYFRTNVASCGSPAAELERARTGAESRNAREAAETAAPVE